MDLSEANYRVGLRTRDDEVHHAIAAANDLILVGGHGGGIVPPGGPLSEVDTWGVYVKATSADQARQMVEDAVAGLEKVAVVVDVQPFSAE